MLVVIFQAMVATADDAFDYEEYSSAASRLRDLAFAKHGCIDFVAMIDGNQELALSW